MRTELIRTRAEPVPQAPSRSLRRRCQRRNDLRSSSRTRMLPSTRATTGWCPASVQTCSSIGLLHPIPFIDFEGEPTRQRRALHPRRLPWWKAARCWTTGGTSPRGSAVRSNWIRPPVTATRRRTIKSIAESRSFHQSGTCRPERESSSTCGLWKPPFRSCSIPSDAISPLPCGRTPNRRRKPVRP